MKIYSMTATFGKLENRTLTFQPGLNVIHAPNEWGKTTWCAFLVNMLYGMETRAKSTKATLADKERYAPWSGSPMSGRIDLNWNGRDITIERRTKGRTPMGEFCAYETNSGMAVPELTGTNCGEQLLGVERSVFLRSDFLRLADLPVTEDESLRRRLNALVTTGDESDAADVLAQRLKELKNKVRYNRTGLLPTAEKEAGELEERLEKLTRLRQQLHSGAVRQESLKEQIAALENHRAALEYAEAQERNRRIAQAQTRRDEAKARLERLEKECADLPDPEKCSASAQQLRQLHQQSMGLDMEMQMLPPLPEKPVSVQSGTAEQVTADTEQMLLAQKQHSDSKKIATAAMIAMILTAVGTVAGLLLNVVLAAVMVALLLGAAACAAVFRNRSHSAQRQMRVLTEKYGSADPQIWQQTIWEAAQEQAELERLWSQRQRELEHYRRKRQNLNEQIRQLTQGQPVTQCLQNWENVARQWDKLRDAQKNYQIEKNHADEVAAMAKNLPKPEGNDLLTCSMEQTVRLLEQAGQEAQLLQQQQGQIQGRMESMGQEENLRCRLEEVHARIRHLTQVYAAMELAQATLAAATAELQRRFAPQIAQQAQTLFGKLTDGRYDRLTISQDLSLQAGAAEEGVLHTVQWRSEGTVDQMYFALRLAVSKALTPDAPLVLDDALVRFDDVRHEAAMQILKEEAQNRQIILFTCQKREEKYKSESVL